MLRQIVGPIWRIWLDSESNALFLIFLPSSNSKLAQILDFDEVEAVHFEGDYVKVSSAPNVVVEDKSGWKQGHVCVDWEVENACKISWIDQKIDGAFSAMFRNKDGSKRELIICSREELDKVIEAKKAA